MNNEDKKPVHIDLELITKSDLDYINKKINDYYEKWRKIELEDPIYLNYIVNDEENIEQ